MEVFELIVDEKVAIWRRSKIKVEAESLSEAVNMCLCSGSDCATDTIDSEYLFETEQPIYPNYENPCTVEVMDSHYKTIKTDECK